MLSIHAGMFLTAKIFAHARTISSAFGIASRSSASRPSSEPQT
jgi:hypothetical protein